MLLDRLENAARYAPLHPLFAEAFAWATNAANHRDRPDGRYALRGEELLVIVETGVTRPAASKLFEAHRRYIDIQVNVIGPEIMGWTPTAGLTTTIDFEPDGDICFFAEPAVEPNEILVKPGHFTVFWPTDAHKPCCQVDGNAAPFRKLVFKVAAVSG